MRAVAYSEQIMCKMPPILIERIKRQAEQDGSNMSEFTYLSEMKGVTVARSVADCISSLTETEAINLHARLRGLSGGSVLDPIVR